MVTADHDRQGQAGHTRYKLRAVVQVSICLRTFRFSLCKIFKCAHLKFTVYMAANKQASKQASIHTHVRNAVTLVWGSIRLAPIILQLSSTLCRAINILLIMHYYFAILLTNRLLSISAYGPELYGRPEVSSLASLGVNLASS